MPYISIEGGEKADCFIGLPIIQFAELDGTAFFIFEYKDKETVEVLIPAIIKMFSNEYESLLLDWDLVGENINEFSHVKILDKIANNTDYFEKIAKNPILQDLGYDQYYQEQQEYFQKRIEDNNEVPKKVIEQYRRTAVMAILIDSFAHNISAHSLTALNWWFTLRAEINKKGIAEELHKDKDIPEQFLTKEPLSREIQPMLKFLLEKGAFWTSLNRERNFGGIINNLYDVLWNSFISNPLYLGSIAFSEGIKKV